MIGFVDVSVKGILEEVSFTADNGCLTALIGRNGAGKTTLLNCVTGQKHQGEVLLDQVPVNGLTPKERARRCAIMPQILPKPSVTVRELVSFGRTPYAPLSGRLTAEDWDIVDSAIETAGLTQLSSASVLRLSGGERRKAFFAMTLAQDTPNIILDEPTAHLDIRARHEFMELLDRMKKEKTILVVLHELTEVLRWADSIVTLEKGRKVFEGGWEDCIGDSIPEKYFGIALSGSRERGFGVEGLV